MYSSWDDVPVMNVKDRKFTEVTCLSDRADGVEDSSDSGEHLRRIWTPRGVRFLTAKQYTPKK